jgi:hypothetical protein
MDPRRRSTTVKEHVARSRALRADMDRAGEKVIRGLRNAAASIRVSRSHQSAKR